MSIVSNISATGFFTICLHFVFRNISLNKHHKAWYITIVSLLHPLSTYFSGSYSKSIQLKLTIIHTICKESAYTPSIAPSCTLHSPNRGCSGSLCRLRNWDLIYRDCKNNSCRNLRNLLCIDIYTRLSICLRVNHCIRNRS